jgi:restriction system protein
VTMAEKHSAKVGCEPPNPKSLRTWRGAPVAGARLAPAQHELAPETRPSRSVPQKWNLRDSSPTLVWEPGLLRGLALSVDEEPVLLHEADLMLAILYAARERPAGLSDALTVLLAHLATARESVPAWFESELRRRLGRALDRLAGAKAITCLNGDRYELTECGTMLLTRHPGGVDQSVLLSFPEFRAYVAAQRRTEPKEDPHLPAFEAGLRAFDEGQTLVDNPHPTDSADHLAWECGWSEARDGAMRL